MDSASVAFRSSLWTSVIVAIFLFLILGMDVMLKVAIIFFVTAIIILIGSFSSWYDVYSVLN